MCFLTAHRRSNNAVDDTGISQLKTPNEQLHKPRIDTWIRSKINLYITDFTIIYYQYTLIMQTMQ